jgi:hypothetical protein
MSVILTNQVNRSEAVTTAGQVAALQERAAAAGKPLDPATLPPAALQPGFPQQVMHDLAHSYTMVFLVAAVLIAAAYLPAALLPRHPVLSRGGAPAPVG